MRIFCTLRILWNGISDWLPIVFHFGTENWEEQLKKSPGMYVDDKMQLFGDVCVFYVNVHWKLKTCRQGIKIFNIHV